jgi:uncharacterized C2H2 Zn-finger protein
MPVFKEMDPELCLRAIEGYTDELTPAHDAQEAFYRQFRCPRCDCPLQKEFNAKTAFDDDSLVAKALLRCPNCSYLVEPHTNVVVETGNPAKVPVVAIPILGQK